MHLPPACCRQVTQAARQGFVGDYMVITQYQLVDSNSSSTVGSAGAGAAQLQVTQRTAAFLQPQDRMFFEAGNRPVAVYDYKYTYTRVAA